MTPDVTHIHVRWAGVVGASSYEIQVNGAVVATAGARARTSKVGVEAATKVEVIDLPARSLTQTLDFSQADGA